MYKKLILVTRKTRLQELIVRFHTYSQAKFYIEHAGGDFADYEREEEAYQRALDVLRRSLEFEIPQQLVDRSLVPTFQLQKEDLVVTLGPDGLVANTAKYVGNQPIVAVNPEPQQFDGVLLPFEPDQARAAVARVMEAKASIGETTLAEVTLTMDSACGLSMTCLSALAAAFPPSTALPATRNPRSSPRAACSYPSALDRLVGFRQCSTWPRAWPNSAAAVQEKQCAFPGRIAA